jgi:hypothetical protein
MNCDLNEGLELRYLRAVPPVLWEGLLRVGLLTYWLKQR